MRRDHWRPNPTNLGIDSEEGPLVLSSGMLLRQPTWIAMSAAARYPRAGCVPRARAQATSSAARHRVASPLERERAAGAAPAVTIAARGEPMALVSSAARCRSTSPLEREHASGAVPDSEKRGKWGALVVGDWEHRGLGFGCALLWRVGLDPRTAAERAVPTQVPPPRTRPGGAGARHLPFYGGVARQRGRGRLAAEVGRQAMRGRGVSRWGREFG
jgi:hypothetical protein